MHAPDYPLPRTGLRILHKRRRDPRRAEILVKNVCIEGPGEQTALVAEGLRDQDENVAEVGSFDAHLKMLP